MAANIKGPELRIVLIGKTGAGKSAAGNIILGNKIFKSHVSSASITQACQKEETVHHGRKIVVVDTPGFFDTKGPQVAPKTAKEVEKCVSYSSPGPHAIIQVIQLGQFSQEEKEVAKKIEEIFSLKVKKYTIILFSRKEDLEGTSLHDFIQNGDQDLKRQVSQCGWRCLAFNNKAKGQEREEQVEELLQIIDRLVEENTEAPYYTKEMFEEDKKQSTWCWIL